MNLVLKYVIGLDFLYCHAKFRGDTISCSRENDIWSCYFWLFSGYSRTKIVTSVLSLWKTGCYVVSMYVLQSYRFCIFYFCKRKTRSETQLWIELAAPYTLANHNEINSHDTLPFIIFLTPVSCDGSNRLLRQRLLLSLYACSLWRHKHTLLGVIRPLAGGKCRTFRRVIVRYRFHRYLLLSLRILRSGFLYIVLYEQIDHIVLKLYSF